MKAYEAVQKFMAGSPKAKRTLRMLEKWDEKLTMQENAKNVFGKAYTCAVQFKNRYKLGIAKKQKSTAINAAKPVNKKRKTAKPAKKATKTVAHTSASVAETASV